MSAPAVPGPPPPHQLDPISEAIGELKADVRTLTREVATLRSEMVTKAELRMLVRLVGGLYLFLLSGLTVIGWLVTRH